MENNIKNLPEEVCNIILSYLDTYSFDIDSVYFYIEPQIFLIDNNLQINLYTWYGIKQPDNYIPCNILHTVFDRPYELRLERSFRNITKILYKNVKKFGYGTDIIDKYHGQVHFAGTYGPLRNNIIGRNKSVYFNRLSNAHFSNQVTLDNLLNYFKRLNILSEHKNQITSDIMRYSIDNLYQLINKSIYESLKEYGKTTANRIKGPYIKENKIFYNLYKNVSDNQVVINKNLLKNL